MKLSTICMAVCAAAPLLIVITLVVMLSNSRFFSSEPNKFPCLFCLTEDDIGDQYGSGIQAPYPMNYYIPPELVALWPARETYVFSYNHGPTGYPYKWENIVYLLSEDNPNLQAIPSGDGIHDVAVAPRVSPDGSHIAYATYRHLSKDPSTAQQLYTNIRSRNY